MKVGLRFIAWEFALLSCLSLGTTCIADDVQMEAVKHWLATPPCFSLIRYSVLDYQEGKEHGYVLAVCGETYAFKQSDTDVDFSVPISRTNRNTSSLFLGRLGSMRWQISSRGYKLTESYNPDMARPDPYAAASDSSLMTIDEPLTFGSMQLQPGSFAWKGDAFTAKLNPISEQMFKGAGRTNATWFRQVLIGNLHRTSPSNLVLSGPLFGHAELTFTKDARLPLGWPKRIEVIRDHKPARRLVFHAVEPGNLAEVRKIANPAHLITAEVTQRSVWKDGVEVTNATPNGLVVSLVQAELADQMRKNGTGLKRKPFYFLLTSVLAIGVLAWIALRGRKRGTGSKPRA